MTSASDATPAGPTAATEATAARDAWLAATAGVEAAAGPVAGPALRRAVDALATQLTVCAAAIETLTAPDTSTAADATVAGGASDGAGTATGGTSDGAGTPPAVPVPAVPVPAASAPTAGTATPAPTAGIASAPAVTASAETPVTSSDHGQVTAVALRLGSVLAKLNPVELVSSARGALAEMRAAPPGDPAVLRAAALATRAAADRVPTGPVTAAVERLDGLVVTSGAVAARVVGAALTRVPEALRAIADGLDALAAAVEDQRRRHGELRDRLSAALHDATHVGSVPLPDPRALDDLARAAGGLVRGALAVHTDAALAADAAAMTFADAGSTARAAAPAGLAPVDALVLAAQSVRVGAAGRHDAGVLTIAQLARAAASLTPATRATVAATASPVERAYVLEVVAAGATDAEVAEFAAEIHGHDDRWLHQHLSLLDRGGPGPQDRFGAEVDQFDAFTCGTTSLVVARAEHDPRHALALTRGLEPPYDAADRDEFDRRLSDVQRRVHDETNSLWPQQFGTLPGGVTAWLGEHCRAARWAWRLVDDTAPRVVSAAVRDVVLAVDAGHLVPLLVGGAVPRHYVLAIGHADGHLLIFEPTSGDVRRVPVADAIAGRLKDTAGFDHLQAVVLPT